MVKVVTAAEFEKEVMKSDKPVLLDFYADWCPPCKKLAPELEKLDALIGDKLKIVKIDVDALQPGDAAYKLMTDRGIRSIPTMLLIKDGKVAAQDAGYKSMTQLTEWVGTVLSIKKGNSHDGRSWGNPPKPGL